MIFVRKGSPNQLVFDFRQGDGHGLGVAPASPSRLLLEELCVRFPVIRDGLLRKETKESQSVLEALVLDSSFGLLEKLRVMDKAIDAAVRSPETLVAALTPKTPKIAVRLIENYSAPVDDTVFQRLTAKDENKPSVLELLIIEPKCGQLVHSLMALNEDFRNAVVSPDMFIAMAKPATAFVCVKLVEEEGLEINQHVVTSLVTGGSLEYKLSEERLNFEEHEAKVVSCILTSFPGP